MLGVIIDSFLIALYLHHIQSKQDHAQLHRSWTFLYNDSTKQDIVDLLKISEERAFPF